MTPRTELAIRSAVVGFVGASVCVVLLATHFGTEFWGLIFYGQSFGFGLLYPLIAAGISLVVSSEFNAENFSIRNGVALSAVSFGVFLLVIALINGLFVLVHGGINLETLLWSFLVFLSSSMAYLMFGSVFLVLIIPLGAILGAWQKAGT